MPLFCFRIENILFITQTKQVMIKFKSSLLMLSALMGSLFLSSCEMGDGTNKYSSTGIFTVEKGATGYTLYADYGGAVIPNTKSLNELTGGMGFNDGERLYLLYSYTDDNIKTLAGKGTYIDQVELVQGQSIPVHNVLLQEKAEADKLLDKDSIFSFANNVTSLNLSAYRGYLTATYNGRYSVVSGKGVRPTLNFVYDPAENERPNTLKLTAVYNRHTAADALFSSQSFISSYALSPFSSLVLGRDSIEIIVDGLGFTQPLTSKIGREDLTPGNYLYYPL